MSLTEFYALPPDEVEDWIAEDYLERDQCKFHHGPSSECADDERKWFPQMTVCQPSMQLAGAQRLYQMLHEEKPYHSGDFKTWSENATPETPFMWADGVAIFLVPDVDLGLGGDFLEQGLGAAPQVAEAVESENKTAPT